MSVTSVSKRLNSAIASLVILAGLITPIIRIAPVSAYNQPALYSQTVLHIKLKNTTNLALSAHAFSGGVTTNTNRLNSLLQGVGSVKNLGKLRTSGSQTAANPAIASALGNYYTITFNNSVNMAKAVKNLQASGLVDAVYPEPEPAPSPSTPSFTNLQDYLNPAPVGINSNYASKIPGGTGSNVKIVDLEYSWNTAHEDLGKAATALVPNGTPADPFSDNNHGTAVLGEIEATNNGFGVTGAANGASLALVNTDRNESGNDVYDLVGALNTAASITKPGDIIQIEQQTYGPDTAGDYVPVEWVPEYYDAIKALTASGRIVVEAGGNGNQNLDDTSLYGSSFPMGQPDSGAIIVGAGDNCDGTTYQDSRLSFSNYGSRVNLQGPGNCVVTTGWYGDLYSNNGDPNTYYTQFFNGTSSATPVVSAAAADLVSAYKAMNNNAVLTPAQVRSILIQNSTPQNTSGDAQSGNIGPYPDLAKALLKADITAPTKPGAPFTKSPTNVTKPTWTWASSTDSGVGLAAVPYTVYWSKSSTFASGVSSGTAAKVTFTQPTALSNGTWYFRVTATDASGNVSAYSPTASVVIDTLAPSVPASFSATQTTISPPKVTVKWAAAKDNVKIASYRLYRNGVLYKTLTAATLSYVDASGLTKGHAYTYAVRAVDTAGNVSASSVVKSVTIH